jgi:putative membrane protein
MAWLMAFHVASLCIWSAGLLYMPALYSREVSPSDRGALRGLRIMSRLVFVGITSPAAVIAIVSGTGLVYATDATGGWLAAKLTLVAMMGLFHAYCGHKLSAMGHEKKRRTQQRFSFAVVLIPVVLIPSVLWLVLAKPVLFLDTQAPIW